MNGCPKCGHPDCYPEDRFCIKCGVKLEAARSASSDTGMTIRVADAAFVQVKLGQILALKGNREGALRACQKALDIDPNCAGAQTLLAELQGSAVAPGGAPAPGAVPAPIPPSA